MSCHLQRVATIKNTLLALVLSAGTVAPATAAVFVDDFNGTSLDAAWGVVKTAPTGFALPANVTSHNAAVSAGKWNISTMTIDANSAIGNVYIQRSISSITTGNFAATMDFTMATSVGTDYGYVTANFLDASDNLVVGGGMFDYGVGNTDAISMANLGSTTDRSLNGGANTRFGPAKTANSHGRLRISRIGSNYSIDIGVVPTAQFDSYDAIALENAISGPGNNSNAIRSLMLHFGQVRIDTNVATPNAMSIDRIEVASPSFTVAGDVNGNGVVDIADYQLLQANAFKSVAFGNSGDLNLDSYVDFEDFRIWKSAFPGGVEAAEAAIAALVPEPASATLLAGSAVLFASVHRRRRAS